VETPQQEVRAFLKQHGIAEDRQLQVVQPIHGHPDDLLRVKHARNRANSVRNSSKVERYLTEVEKVHGFATSWVFRERLERGDATLVELMRR